MKASISAGKKARPERAHKGRSEAKWQKKAEMISVSCGTVESENSSAELLRSLAFAFSEAIRILPLRLSRT
jgi:hypothetical protein